jgi:hypothetical protein
MLIVTGGGRHALDIVRGIAFVTSLEFQPNPRSGSSGDTRKTLKRWRRLDGRLRAAKRIKGLTAQYRRAIGTAAKKPLWLARVRELAEYQVLVEEMRGALLRGEHVDILALNRLTNTLRRLRDSLGLDGAPPPPPEPTFADVLRGNGIKHRRSGR